MENIDITPLLTQLGIGVVFLYLLIILWKDYKCMIKEKDDQIMEKDKIIVALLKDMSSVFQQNIQATTDVKNAVENNTYAIRCLTTKLETVLQESEDEK